MSGNRRAAEKEILTWIEELLPGSGNTAMYKELFAGMSDKEFDAFMVKLEKEEIDLTIIAPNMGEFKLTVERNFEVAKKLNHNFFERIWMDDGNDVPPYLTPIKYLIVDLPLRRQAQLLTKKISIPKDNHSVDNLTGQPTGKSKGSKMSYPETQIMAAMGLDQNLVEMLKYRGGDLRGFNAMNTSLSKTGGVSLDALDKLGTKVKSTQTLNTVLVSMHISNTLTQ